LGGVIIPFWQEIAPRPFLCGFRANLKNEQIHINFKEKCGQKKAFILYYI
jgi:hypothetical protein